LFRGQLLAPLLGAGAAAADPKTGASQCASPAIGMPSPLSAAPIAGPATGHIDVVSVEIIDRCVAQIEPGTKHLGITLP